MVVTKLFFQIILKLLNSLISLFTIITIIDCDERYYYHCFTFKLKLVISGAYIVRNEYLLFFFLIQVVLIQVISLASNCVLTTCSLNCITQFSFFSDTRWIKVHHFIFVTKFDIIIDWEMQMISYFWDHSKQLSRWQFTRTENS